MLENAHHSKPTLVTLFTPTHPTRRHKQSMNTGVDKLAAWERIILAIAEFDYLSAVQVTRLLYSPSSLTYVRERLKSLVDTGYLLPLAGRAVNMPRIFTLTVKGRRHAALLGVPPVRRFRPSEQQELGVNSYYMKHALAVSDVLIAARLLSQSVTGIALNRMYRERELRRTIYVTLPQLMKQSNGGGLRKICIEPDASLDFTIEDTWHQQTFRDFFHIEVYRHLPMETRFKQKVQGYVVMAQTGRQEELFQTSAISIAVFAATDHLARVLKRWTEEALQQLNQPAEGQRFFIASIDTSAASPTEIYLAPVWQQAFGSTPTPLLILEEEANEQ
jgi:hypothetical protein